MGVGVFLWARCSCMLLGTVLHVLKGPNRVFVLNFVFSRARYPCTCGNLGSTLKIARASKLDERPTTLSLEPEHPHFFAVSTVR